MSKDASNSKSRRVTRKANKGPKNKEGEIVKHYSVDRVMYMDLEHDDGAVKTHKCADIFATAFVDNPNNYPTTCFLDFDPKNLEVSNIIWSTNELDIERYLSDKEDIYKRIINQFGLWDDRHNELDRDLAHYPDDERYVISRSGMLYKCYDLKLDVNPDSNIDIRLYAIPSYCNPSYADNGYRKFSLGKDYTVTRVRMMTRAFTSDDTIYDIPEEVVRSVIMAIVNLKTDKAIAKKYKISAAHVSVIRHKEDWHELVSGQLDAPYPENPTFKNLNYNIPDYIRSLYI